MSVQTSLIDIESLLIAISADNPSGEDLTYASTYYDIKQARLSEDNLPQGEWKRETKNADWQKVIDIAVEALTHKTKDLQICVWLTEALTITQGFGGMRDGLKLIGKVQEDFWESLYPSIDLEDADYPLDARANAITNLNKLAITLKELPLTHSVTGVNYSYRQWEESKQFFIPEKLEDLDLDEKRTISELKSRAEQENKITSEQWRIAKNGTRRHFYEELSVLVNECLIEAKQLDKIIDEKFADHTPGLSELGKSLEDIDELVHKLLNEKRLQEPDLTPVSPASTRNGETTHAQIVTPSATFPQATFVSKDKLIQNRQDAFIRLAEIADYFSQTEPHNPVAYLVRLAIKWGNMTLSDWLDDALKNEEARYQLRESLGIKSLNLDTSED